MSMKQCIQIVSFDAFNTLIRPRASIGQLYAERFYESLPNLHIEIDADRMQSCFWSSYVAHDRSEPCFGYHNSDPERTIRGNHERNWWREVVHNCFTSYFQKTFNVVPLDVLRSRQLLGDNVFNYFKSKQAWTLEPTAFETLELLRHHHSQIRLGMISNFDCRLWSILKSFGIYPTCIDFLLLSGQLGVAKPDTAIFLRLCEAYRLPPSSMVHVGDSEQKDCEGAMSAGFQNAILYSTASTAEDERNKSGCSANRKYPVVNRLIDILQYVGIDK